MSKKSFLRKAPSRQLVTVSSKVRRIHLVRRQGPFDPITGDVAGRRIQEQTKQGLRNVEAILRAGGERDEKVVRRHVHSR